MATGRDVVGAAMIVILGAGTSALAAGEFKQVGPPGPVTTMVRIRTDDPDIARAIAQAIEWSDTFRRLVEAIERTDGMVHANKAVRGFNAVQAGVQEFPPSRRLPKQASTEATSFRQVEREADVAGERVRVKTAAQLNEAAGIMATARRRFGVVFASASIAKGLREKHSMTRGIEPAAWEFQELKAIERALGSFGPLFGPTVEPLNPMSQGIRSIGKILRVDSPSVAGEYVPAIQGVAIYKAPRDGRTPISVRPNVAWRSFVSETERLYALVAHELAHGLLRHRYTDFIHDGSGGYWLPTLRRSGRHGAEEPPTDLAMSHPSEDLAESVALYLSREPAFRKRCPARWRWVDSVIAYDSPTPTGTR